jgi:hypothetical protein
MKQRPRFLVAACAAILFSLSAMAAETQLVTATGYGMNVEEAKKAAVRAAVESVVGTLVDAETLVENDELVQDKILSYSAGMVEDVKIIGAPEKTPAGLVIVRAQVKVRKTELAERIKAAIKTSVKIDGESLYQQVAFNQRNFSDADGILQNLFDPGRLPGLMKFEADTDNGNPVSVNPRTGEVTVAIKGGVNLAAYKQWTDEIIAKLGPMAAGKATDSNVFGLKEDGTFYWSHARNANILWKLDGYPKGLCILRGFRSGEVVGLAFDEDKWALLKKRMYPCEGAEWTVSVSLVDKMGEKIKTAEAGFDDAFFLSDSSTGNTCLLPAYQLLDGDYNYAAGPFERAKVSLGRLQPQDLRDVDSVIVEVRVEPPSYNPYEYNDD